MATELKFIDKYVAFIDVLGFSEMVYKNNNNDLNAYFDTAREIFDTYSKYKGKLQKTMISDSIILAAEKSNDGLITILTAIQTLQSRMALKGIFMRGGLSIGEVDFNETEGIIVGKGFINAYRLEGIAKYPRVIVDPTILVDLGIVKREFLLQMNCKNGNYDALKPDKLIHNDFARGLIKFSEDDAIVVEYTYKMALETFIDFRNDYQNSPLNTLYNQIQSKIYNDQKNYHKYAWLKTFISESIQKIRPTTLDPEQSMLDDGWLNEKIFLFSEL